MRDLYEVLGVERTATPAQIKVAYRKRSKGCHPDSNKGDPEAEERFKELGRAYAILNDPIKRRTYDQTGDADAADGSLTDAMKALQQMFFQIFLHEAETADLVQLLCAELDRNDSVIKNSRMPERVLKRAKVAAVLKRLKFDPTGVERPRNFLAQALQSQDLILQAEQQEDEDSLRTIAEMRVLLLPFSYDLSDLQRRAAAEKTILLAGQQRRWLS